MKRPTLCVCLLALAALLAACGTPAPDDVPAVTPLPTLQAAGPPCRFIEFGPWRNVETTCSEIVYDNVVAPEAVPELMGMALGRDGTLYVARTARGEIWALPDAEGDLFYDEPYRVAADLTFPTSLAAHDGALYVASVGGLVRLELGPDGTADSATVLVADLEAESGFWPGSVRVGPDGRLYVSTGSSDDEAGSLLSFALDGSDRRVEATGLRYPADFDWHPATGELWVVDSAAPVPGADATAPADELNVLVSDARSGAPADFGYPLCQVHATAPPGDACAQTTTPAFMLPSRSQPTGLAFYPAVDVPEDAPPSHFPFWEDHFIVVLHGGWPSVEPQGYAVGVVDPARGLVDYVAPVSAHPSFDAPPPKMSLFRQGFFPYHPVDVVVDARGWLYVSVEEGRIFRFRPRPAAR